MIIAAGVDIKQAARLQRNKMYIWFKTKEEAQEFQDATEHNWKKVEKIVKKYTDEPFTTIRVLQTNPKDKFAEVWLIIDEVENV